MIKRFYIDNNFSKDMKMKFNAPLIFNRDDIVEIQLTSHHIIFINQLEIPYNCYLFVDKINDTYYYDNPLRMPCNLLDSAIAPRSNSNTLYVAKYRNKRTKLHIENYLNNLVVSILSAQYNQAIISNYNTTIDITVTKQKCHKERRIKLNFLGSNTTITTKFDEMIYINDDEILEISLTDFYTFST